MSIEARQKLVNSPNTFFQKDSQRADLLDPKVTNTELIALLLELIDKGWSLEFTSVRSDHSSDACLGLHSHQNGYACDFWPLNAPRAGDYVASDCEEMREFLSDIAKSRYLYQIGLGGSSDTPNNRLAAGPTVFGDNLSDHVHIGAQ